MATRSSIDCSISYYGVGLDELTNEVNNVTKPLMLHIAEEDGFVTKEAQAKIKEDLSPHKLITIHSYENVDHAFARGNGQNYDEKAATLANKRSLSFLEKSLNKA